MLILRGTLKVEARFNRGEGASGDSSIVLVGELPAEDATEKRREDVFREERKYTQWWGYHDPIRSLQEYFSEYALVQAMQHR